MTKLERSADIVATVWLVGIVVWALGAIIGAWLTVATAFVVWAILRGLPVWWPSVWTAGSILFGDRYSDTSTVRELLSEVGEDMKEELVPTVLAAAKKVHNWGSRAGAATVSILGLLAMWAARDTWQPFIFLLFALLVIGFAFWPAFRRRWDERNGA